jgi:hypothetical protein
LLLHLGRREPRECGIDLHLIVGDTDVANFTELLCGGISKGKFQNGCKVIGNAIRAYCNVGDQPHPEGGTLADVLCDPDTPIEHRGVPVLPDQSVTLQPDVLVPGFDRIVSPPKVVFENDPLPVFTVDIPVDEPKVLTFTTAPVDPGPAESYTATVDFCMPEGESLSLFIDGTDGYMDATSCPSTGTINACRLLVPGAEEGVRDKLTATTGNNILKTIELEF